MALPAKGLSPIDQVRTDLSKMESQFKMALPPNVTPEKFIRVTLTAIQNNPALLNCDRQSLFSSAMRSAQDGLLPDGREAALVQFKDKVQYMPMVGGILKKVRNSGELASITSQIVYKNDKFRYWVDADGEHLEHEPLMFGERGERLGVYAIAKTKDGAVYIETMTFDQVMDVRKCSRASNGPWNGPFETEMWRKTAIRRLSKRLPMSTDLEDVVKADDEMYDLTQQTAQKTKIEELQAQLANQSMPHEPIFIEDKAAEPSEFDKFDGATMTVAEDQKVVK